MIGDMTRDDATLSRACGFTAVEVPCGAGARDSRCRDGPIRFHENNEAALGSRGVVVNWRTMPDGLCTIDIPPLDAVARMARWTAGTTYRLATNGDRFLVIGGDHSCAIGTWSGTSDALRGTGPLGLIWIDAHMDMHVPETTHSGAINGMPVACLLGYGAPVLTAIAQAHPAIDPRHICLVGTRSFEAEEIAFAKRLGVRVIGMEEVRRRGVAAALSEAQRIASNGTVGYGVSLDLDALDPSDAPGVGTPEPDGIRAAVFLQSWRSLIRDSGCVGIEIVEYNPSRDQSGRTEKLIYDLIAA